MHTTTNLTPNPDGDEAINVENLVSNTEEPPSPLNDPEDYRDYIAQCEDLDDMESIRAILSPEPPLIPLWKQKMLEARKRRNAEREIARQQEAAINLRRSHEAEIRLRRELGNLGITPDLMITVDSDIYWCVEDARVGILKKQNVLWIRPDNSD